MKRHLLAVLGFAGLLLTSQRVFAETKYFYETRNKPYDIYTLSEDLGGNPVFEVVTQFPYLNPGNSPYSFAQDVWHDTDDNRIYALDSSGYLAVYDISTDTWSDLGQDSNIANQSAKLMNNFSALDLDEITNRNASDVSTNTSDIQTNASDITTNASDISDNSSDISDNSPDISANATDIQTNASDISKMNRTLK